MAVKILRGEGIECENELERHLVLLGQRCEFWDLPRLLKNPDHYFQHLGKGDWIFLPGGFSFSDHLGSGRLLAFELESIQFLERSFRAGASLWGICNGFQVLASLGVFGDVQLLHNQFSKGPSRFVDRWVSLYSPILREDFFYPVRHGEGRLKIHHLAPETEVFLRYVGDWKNGSDRDIAGLIRKVGRSLIIGLMPHGEIASRPEQNPDFHFSDSNHFDLRRSIFRFLDQNLSFKEPT